MKAKHNILRGDISMRCKRWRTTPLRAEHVMSDNIAESIVRAAREYGCDSIVMASHGRRGLSKVLLGSETQKVLVESDVPVVVTR
jgi:nucleotide-binding universal stress UspA family protein